MSAKSLVAKPCIFAALVDRWQSLKVAFLAFVASLKGDERTRMLVGISLVVVLTATFMFASSPAHAQADILEDTAELTTAAGQLLASTVMLVIVIAGLAWTGWRAMSGVQGAWSQFAGAAVVSLLLSPLITQAITTFTSIAIP